MYEIYSLCKNNAISKVLNKLQVFNFRSTVYTNTTPTVITHWCVLQKPPSCNDNGYKFEFFIDQIGTSVRFWPKKVKCWNFEGDCEQNGSTGKVASWGDSYLFMKYDVFIQNAEFLLGIELISFKWITRYLKSIAR